MTITELAMLGKPAILIPSPNVTDNHQYKNAKALADKGAAILIAESELTGRSITAAVESIYNDPTVAHAMSQAIREFSNPHVNSEIYEHISRLIKNRAKIKREGT